jgi:hypothetical protein
MKYSLMGKEVGEEDKLANLLRELKQKRDEKHSGEVLVKISNGIITCVKSSKVIV